MRKFLQSPSTPPRRPAPSVRPTGVLLFETIEKTKLSRCRRILPWPLNTTRLKRSPLLIPCPHSVKPGKICHNSESRSCLYHKSAQPVANPARRQFGEDLMQAIQNCGANRVPEPCVHKDM